MLIFPQVTSCENSVNVYVFRNRFLTKSVFGSHANWFYQIWEFHFKCYTWLIINDIIYNIHHFRRAQKMNKCFHNLADQSTKTLDRRTYIFTKLPVDMFDIFSHSSIDLQLFSNSNNQRLSILGICVIGRVRKSMEERLTIFVANFIFPSQFAK